MMETDTDDRSSGGGRSPGQLSATDGDYSSNNSTAGSSHGYARDNHAVEVNDIMSALYELADFNVATDPTTKALGYNAHLVASQQKQLEKQEATLREQESSYRKAKELKELLLNSEFRTGVVCDSFLSTPSVPLSTEKLESSILDKRKEIVDVPDSGDTEAREESNHVFKGNVSKYYQDTLHRDVIHSRKSSRGENKYTSLATDIAISTLAISPRGIDNVWIRDVPVSSTNPADYQGAERVADRLMGRTQTFYSSKKDDDSGKVTRTEEKKSTITRRDNLTSRARSIADSIASDKLVMTRMAKFLVSAHINELFSVAVCRAILNHRKFQATHLMRLHQNKEDITALINNVKIRAAMPLNVIVVENDGAPDDMIKEGLAAYREFSEPLRVDPVLSVALTIVNNPVLRDACHSSTVCPICLAAMISNQSAPDFFPTNVPESKLINMSYLKSKVNSNNNDAYLNAVAALHNREMHSMNGNIVVVASVDEPRNVLANRMAVMAGTPGLRVYAGNPRMEAQIVDAEQDTDRIAVRVGHNTSYSIAAAPPTLHQYVSTVSRGDFIYLTAGLDLATDQDMQDNINRRRASTKAGQGKDSSRKRAPKQDKPKTVPTGGRITRSRVSVTSELTSTASGISLSTDTPSESTEESCLPDIGALVGLEELVEEVEETLQDNETLPPPPPPKSSKLLDVLQESVKQGGIDKNRAMNKQAHSNNPPLPVAPAGTTRGRPIPHQSNLER